MLVRCLLSALICSALVFGCQAQRAVVDNLSSCPTNNELYSNAAKIEGTLHSWLNDTLSFNQTACTSALQNLTACSTDGNNSSTNSSAALSSLRIQQGCCSSVCAAAVEQALVTSGPGCYRTFLGAICDSGKFNSSLSGPLFSLTQRCLGLNASCAALKQPGDLLPPELAARNLATNSSMRNTTANSSSNTSNADNASNMVNAGSKNASVTANRAEPPAPVVPPLAAPDPYRLIPQQSGPASESFLATPEEIEQAAKGAGTRRMLEMWGARQASGERPSFARRVPCTKQF